jgi:predicted transglutaminase-like cysteine proteinase
MMRSFSPLFVFFALLIAPAVAQQKYVSLPAETRDVTSPPVGWVQFCADEPRQCALGTTRPVAVLIDSRNWKQLNRINKAVNDQIEPVSDLEHWGVIERWSLPTDGRGDCEDYALEKRERLIKTGWPRQALLMTVVRDQKGDGHAVLTVVTDRGDFILDNQDQRIRAWEETGYRFVKRQSQTHPDRWVSLGSTAGGIHTANR